MLIEVPAGSVRKCDAGTILHAEDNCKARCWHVTGLHLCRVIFENRSHSLLLYCLKLPDIHQPLAVFFCSFHMTLQSIQIPEEINQLAHSKSAARLIDTASQRITEFTRSQDALTENFVPCDFHLLDQALTWIEQNHLLTGRRFCELGSGFGVAALLASMHGMESVGIEIESVLVEQSNVLADDFGLAADFYCGSFVPRDIAGILELSREVERIETHEGDVYEEIGLGLNDFDLLFAFPWPGNQHFFDAVFQAGAADNSLLLSYHGRNGMRLVRKT